MQANSLDTVQFGMHSDSFITFTHQENWLQKFSGSWILKQAMHVDLED